MNETTTLVFLNELEVDADGWAQIAPWGDYPAIATEINPDGTHRRFRAVQRLDREAGIQMANQFAVLRDGAKGRWPIGLEIFEGHPDAPIIGDRWKNKSAIGTLVGVQVRDAGLYGAPVFTARGAALLAGPVKLGFSGRWTAVPTGKQGGVPIYSPSELKSVGVTDNPNLPVEMLNECERSGEETSTQQKVETMNRDKILAWIKGHGVELANDAGDEQIDQGLTTLSSKLNKLGSIEQDHATAQARVTELSNERTALTTERDALKTQVGILTSERDTARVQFTNERAARKGLLLDGSLRDGRITAAERPQWDSKLETDFSNASEELAKRPVTIKTVPITGDAGSRKVDLANCRTFSEVVQHFIGAGKKKVDALDAAIAAAPALYTEYRNVGGSL